MDTLEKMLLDKIASEYEHAKKKHSDFQTTHHGYAVILEELDEMWEAIKKDDLKQARIEAAQVGAMALRFMVDLRRT